LNKAYTVEKLKTGIKNKGCWEVDISERMDGK
jgi:hypothetical protein